MKHILTVVTLVVSIGCAQQAADKESETSTTPAMRAMGQSVSTEETRSDEAIGAEIRDQLNRDAKGELAGVVVEIVDGTVTLSGTAPSLQAAWRAQAAANAVKGVKMVVNNIIVTSQRP
jgi:osmotically-inducible protein OsmY